MIWVGSIQGYRDVKFTKPYATAFVLCFKEEKKESFSQGKNFCSLWSQTWPFWIWDWIWSCCVTSGRLCYLSVPYFPIVDKNSVGLLGLRWGLKGLVAVIFRALFGAHHGLRGYQFLLSGDGWSPLMPWGLRPSPSSLCPPLCSNNRWPGLLGDGVIEVILTLLRGNTSFILNYYPRGPDAFSSSPCCFYLRYKTVNKFHSVHKCEIYHLTRSGKWVDFTLGLSVDRQVVGALLRPWPWREPTDLQ